MHWEDLVTIVTEAGIRITPGHLGGALVVTLINPSTAKIFVWLCVES